MHICVVTTYYAYMNIPMFLKIVGEFTLTPPNASQRLKSHFPNQKLINIVIRLQFH